MDRFHNLKEAALLRSFGKRALVGVLTAIFALVGLGSWALASPVGASPDEDFHLPSIWCGLGDREGLCEEAGNLKERSVQEELVNSSSCYAFDNEKSAACSYDERKFVETARGNFGGMYPPIFYGTMSIFASSDVTVSTLIMRVFNATLFVAIFAGLFLMLNRGQRGPLVWGTMVTVVPLGMFLIPSVNPSSWAILSAAMLWVALVGYFTTSSRAFRIGFGIVAMLLALMGAGARGDSASYVAMSAFLASVLTFERHRSWMKLALLPAFIVAVGAFFFITSSQTGSTLAQGAESPVVSFATAIQSVKLNLPLLPSLWVGSLGTWGLGWLDTSMPPAVWVTMIVMFAGVTFWGLNRMNRRKGLAVALIALALIVVPMYALIRDQIMVGAYLQPRYLLPMLFIFAGISLYGFQRDDLGLTRTQSVVVVAGVSGANALALYVNLRRYITGFDYRGFSLNANVEWWWSIPLSPMALWLVGSFSVAACLGGILMLLRPSQGSEKQAIQAA